MWLLQCHCVTVCALVWVVEQAGDFPLTTECTSACLVHVFAHHSKDKSTRQVGMMLYRSYYQRHFGRHRLNEDTSTIDF